MKNIKPTCVEISQLVSPDGRRRVKFALHSIYEDETKCNLNGITYLEEYTRLNATSIIGMPLCAAFLDDDKEMPYDHGLTGNEGVMPIFEDSVQVGAFDSWEIEDILVEGVMQRALTACGYVNQQRYPKFVNWLENQQKLNIQVCGSIEFVGTKKNKTIIYKDGKTKDDKYRVPISYVYSGFCFLSVKASDSNAIMVEFNQFNNKEKQKERNLMDEKMLSQFVDSIKTTVLETNSKTAEFETKITELNSEITQLNSKCKKFEENEVEKDEIIKKSKELNEDLTNKLNKLTKESKIGELNAALVGYTDKQKEFAKEEIEKFNADPVTCDIEINSIITKIKSSSYQAILDKQVSETNAKKDDVKLDDIFGEVNSVDNKVLDLTNVFN